MSELLFKHYLISHGDIRKCPNAKCSYAGYISFTMSGRIDCGDELECSKCGTKWTDPLMKG